MSTLRVYKSSALTPPLLRVYKSSASGTAPSNPILKVYKSSATGTTTPIIDAPTQFTIGPGENVTVTPVLLYGLTADSWSWRRISGPNTTLSGTGATRVVTGPSVWPPSPSAPTVTLLLGVTATVGSLTSAEHVITVTVLPQTAWSYSSTASAWVGALTAPA